MGDAEKRNKRKKRRPFFKSPPPPPPLAMPCPSLFLLALLFCLSCLSFVPFSLQTEESSKALDSAACRELGFTESLMCSSCFKLSDFVGDEELVEECKSCCHQDVLDSDARYPY